jgi:DNA mismatch repair protein MutL
MGIIKLLDDDTINKIAAGEVVNRPSSVVKELIENSIDAKSTEIKIEIENAGKKLIKVIDNGVGMTPEDAKMSLVRHATSKISDSHDLNFLNTLGFRGEAIPSIASVSQFTIITASSPVDMGCELILKDGKIVSEKKVISSMGTTIVVKDLFLNIPVRLKFLKADSTEFAHILKIVTGIALVNPNIAFSLFHNNKKIFSSIGNGNSEEVLADIFSYNVFQKMLPVKFSDQEVAIFGYISTPEETRTLKDKQIFVVNNRIVSNSLLYASVNQALKFIFSTGQQPYLYLNIKIDPSEVDVNVHPSKSEIKIYKEKFIFEAISIAIKNTFRISPKILNHNSSIGDNKINYNYDDYKKKANSNTNFFVNADKLFSNEAESKINNFVLQYNDETKNNNPLIKEKKNIVTSVFQFKDTYLVFYYQNKLTIIDQHVAHERVIFEKLKARNYNKGIQELLFPENIFLDKQDYLIFNDMKDIFLDIGYNIDFFGEDSLIIRAVPIYLSKKINHKEVVLDILSDSKNVEKVKDKETHILTTIACKSAIKAGDILEEMEKVAIVNEWIESPNRMSCPHGRPIEKSFNEKEIDKWFHRG